MPTTLDLRLEGLVLRQWNGKLLLEEIVLGVCSGNEMKERQIADCQFCRLSTTFPDNSSRYALKLLRPIDAACPRLICSDFITFFQWCLCVSSFGSQFCHYVTAIDHLSLLLFPHLPIRFFCLRQYTTSFNITSYRFNFLYLFANTFVLVCNFTCFFADVKLGCTH
jgi:hypothetical protein